jgi:aspartate kinase
MRQGIPLRILNSLNPTHPGTLVSAVGCLSASGVKAVTSIGNVALIAIDGKGMQEIPGVAAKALEAVSAEQANVLLTSQASSEKNISIAINASDAPRVTRALRSAFEFEVTLGHIDEISAVNSLAVVAVVGEGMKRTAGIATTTFGALGTAGVKVIAISQGSSERSISLLVAEKDAATSVRAIHRAFQLEKSASSQDRRTLEQVSR